MNANPTPQLTHELVIMAIGQGMLDDQLDLIIEAARNRREIAATRKAINLDSGDEFHIVNISPKYLSGAHVRLIRHEDGWLLCEMLSWPGGRYAKGDKIKLRHTHVGIITKRVSGTEA